jgi:response regulator RpfG family c-di-GMP phosphodiesterase
MFKIKLILMLVVLAGAAGGFAYVKNLQAQNEILRLNQEKLEGAIELQQELVEQQLADIQSIQEINTQLNETNNAIAEQLKINEEKFNKINASGSQRDIGDLAVNRPASIERILNKRLREQNRCIELEQGAPRTEEEIAATRKSQTNQECPALANPNYVDY